MLNGIKLILITVLLTFSFTSQASSYSLGTRIELSSKVLKQNREVQVLLPENYYANPDASYPVLYLLDGDYNFIAVAGMLDLMANKAQLIPDMIVVAIADKGTEQYRQYMTPNGLNSPLKQEDKGQATEFLDFITTELKPYINQHYRTASNDILFGHSIAGLFTLNALIAKPNSFNHYFASSPSLWLNNQTFTKLAAEKIKQQTTSPVSLMLSLGDETRMNQYGFINILDELQPSHINWRFNHYPNENHNSVGMIALRDNLKYVFKDWFINEQRLRKDFSGKDIINHYIQLSQDYNIKQPIPTPSIKSAIRGFYINKQQDKIDELLKVVAKKLPHSEQAFLMMQASYMSHFNSPQQAVDLLLSQQQKFAQSIEYHKAIAVQFEALKQQQGAINYYQKALKLANEQKANQWQLNIITAKLAALTPQ